MTRCYNKADNWRSFFFILFITINGACSQIDDLMPSNDGNIGVSNGKDTLIALQSWDYNGPKLRKNISIKPILYQGNIIFSYAENKSNELLMSYRISDWVSNWVWDGYKFGAEGERERDISFLRWSPKFINQNQIIIFTNKAIYAINTANGVTDVVHAFSDNLNHSNYTVNVLDDFNSILYSVFVGNKSYFMICNNYLECRKIDSVENKGHYFSALASGTMELSNSDTILYYTAQKYRTSGRIEEGPYDTVWITKKNITLDQKEWSYGESRYEVGSLDITAHPPVVTGDKVLFLLSAKMLCIDKNRGDLIWSYEYGPASGFAIKPIVSDGRIYFGDGKGDISCIDFETGQLIWKITHRDLTGGGVNDLILYKSKLYAVDLVSLVVVEAETGRGIGKYASPNARYNSGAEINSITIDEERGVMYVDDGYSILECEIPGK